MRIEDLNLPAEAAAKAEHLLDKLRGIDLPAPTGYHILALLYVRPEKSRGGIMFADQTKKEDEYQGRAGLVLALGPDCYKGDKFAEPWCKVGDWVLWPPLEAAAARATYNGVVLAVLNDDRITMTGIDPLMLIGGNGVRVAA